MKKIPKETRDDILESLAKKVSKEPTYKNNITYINTKHRYDAQTLKEEQVQALIDLQKAHGIEPKERATYKELLALFDMVLETGRNGTHVIREYAEQNNKSKKWVDDIAKPYRKELIKKILEENKENLIIEKMIENKVYDPKEIYNKSVTGALTKLSKQMQLSQEKERAKEEIEELKKCLAIKESLAKEDKIDWEIAQELRNAGMSVREVAAIVGASPSAVSKYTTKPPKR
ncbi:MAG: hypothetical protein ACXW2E_11885 [Nitrososphaeraceae archaeon]